ncbi:hypothetical protein AYI68_g5719, partial [Smittium mucronatum]
ESAVSENSVGDSPAVDTANSNTDNTSTFEKHVVGCLLGFKSGSPIDKFATIKKAFNEYAKVQFVEIDADNLGGIIRFKEPVAETVLDTIVTADPETKAVVIDSHPVSVHILDDDQTRQFSQRLDISSSNCVCRSKASAWSPVEYICSTISDMSLHTLCNSRSRSPSTLSESPDLGLNPVVVTSTC